MHFVTGGVCPEILSFGSKAILQASRTVVLLIMIMMMIMMMIRPHHKHASVEYRATHRLRSTTVAFASPISPPYTNYIFTVISDLFQSQTAQIFLLYICSLTHSFTAISKLSYFCPCVNITKNQCVCVLCIVYTLEHAIPSSFDVLNKLCKSTTIDS